MKSTWHWCVRSSQQQHFNLWTNNHQLLHSIYHPGMAMKQLAKVCIEFWWERKLGFTLDLRLWQFVNCLLSNSISWLFHELFLNSRKRTSYKVKQCAWSFALIINEHWILWKKIKKDLKLFLKFFLAHVQSRQTCWNLIPLRKSLNGLKT